MLYNKEYNRKTFKWVKSKAEVSGSNRKPHPQKKTGRARQGNIRSPNLYHGGKAHGERPREFYFPLNKKIRLLALKSALTSKLVENKIIIVDREKYSTTSEGGFKNYFNFLKGNRALMVIGSNANEAINSIMEKNVPHVELVKANVKLKSKNFFFNFFLIFFYLILFIFIFIRKLMY
jgi:large subunit ribosomal protein L4